MFSIDRPSKRSNCPYDAIPLSSRLCRLRSQLGTPLGCWALTMWALGTVVLVCRLWDLPRRLSSPCSRCDSSVWVTWLTNTGTLSSVWHSTVRSNEEEADLPTTR